MTEHTAEDALAWKSGRWRNAGGWLVVSIIAWRYLLHPLADTIIIAQGGEALQPSGDLDLTDIAIILGLPIGGSFADKMTETTNG